MQQLRTRYENEGRDKEVALLRQGLQHLESSGLIDRVARARAKLEIEALPDALREQNDVVSQVEQLIDILLDRRSIDSLDKEIERASAQAKRASELAERQQELIDQLDDVRSRNAGEAEKALDKQLDQLATQFAREADRNQDEAGEQTRSLERALGRINKLLQQQTRLEQTLSNRSTGERDPARKTVFELGALEQEQRELQSARGTQRDLALLAQAAQDYLDALTGGDTDSTTRERDRLLAKARGTLDELPPNARSAVEEGLEKVAGSTNASDKDEARQSARRGAEQIRDAARDAARAVEKETDDKTRKAADEVRKLAAKVREQARQRSGSQASPSADQRNDASQPPQSATADALDRAAEALRQSSESSAPSPRTPQDGQTSTQAANPEVEPAEADRPKGHQAADDSARKLTAGSRTLRAMNEARKRFEQENPGAAERSARMASEAQQVARDLRNSPQPEEAEDRASEALDNASQALRHAGDQLDREDAGGDSADQTALQQNAERSRSELESARDALQKALQANTETKEAGMQAARDRNAALQQKLDQAQTDLQNAQQSGQISSDQARAVERSLQQASQSAQQAGAQLDQSMQSQASQSQQQAAEQLDGARRALEQNRPLDDDAKRALEDLKDRQAELERDIIDLAEEIEEGENHKAQRALQNAQAASQSARNAMERGDTDGAREQQERAQEELEKAFEEIEEERDRYQDLRQDELLFKIREELEQFLEQQRPITVETLEVAKKSEGRSRLSRPTRRRLQQLGETEVELRSRITYVREAIAAEGTLVFTHVLESNERDLAEIAELLGRRRPDPGEYTQLLQTDVERRTEQLLIALEREQKRRAEERQDQQQQQQQQSENQFGPRTQRLVPAIAELEMLKQLEEGARFETEKLRQLLELTGEEGITDVEVRLSERLANRHAAISNLFGQIKLQIEQALAGPEGGDASPDGESEDENRGR